MDLHRVDADPNPDSDPTFHFDGVSAPNPDPDTDPDPYPKFYTCWKSEFLFDFYSQQCQGLHCFIFVVSVIGVNFCNILPLGQYIGIFWYQKSLVLLYLS